MQAAAVLREIASRNLYDTPITSIELLPLLLKIRTGQKEEVEELMQMLINPGLGLETHALRVFQAANLLVTTTSPEIFLKFARLWPQLDGPIVLLQFLARLAFPFSVVPHTA